jgi:hypothetical protein
MGASSGSSATFLILPGSSVPGEAGLTMTPVTRRLPTGTTARAPGSDEPGVSEATW